MGLRRYYYLILTVGLFVTIEIGIDLHLPGRGVTLECGSPYAMRRGKRKMLCPGEKVENVPEYPCSF